jgi:hypothetical protein
VPRPTAAISAAENSMRFIENLSPSGGVLAAGRGI